MAIERRVALVTGANKGIGLATVKELCRQGFIALLTSRNEKRGRLEVEKIWKEYPNQIYYYYLDVLDEQSIAAAARQIETDFSSFDVLINNAAVYYDTWQDVCNVEDFTKAVKAFEINVFGVWRTTHFFSPLIKKNAKKGVIINISSGAGAIASQTGQRPVYSLSKVTLNMLTIQWAQALSGTGIKVYSVCPGWVRTDMGGMSATKSPEQAAKDIVAMIDANLVSGKFYREGMRIPL